MATVTKPIALDESFNTTEVTPRNIADVLAEGLSHITGRTASEVEYDNTNSGLTADNVQDALDEIAESVPTLPTTDIQTAVDEFETYNGGLLSECKVALSPNQDLHGYENPWVGGAGKNKANPDNLEVGYYSTTGYNNSPNFKTTEPIAVENGQTYSGSLFNSNDLTERYNAVLTTFSSGDTTNAIRQVVGESITIQSGESFIRIRNNSDQTPLIQSGDFYYQLEKSASATAYEPYSNICPISGHTQVEVGNHQKNLFNPSNVLNAFFFNGYNITDEPQTRTIYAQCKPNTVYTVSKTAGQRFCVGYTKELPANGVVVYDKTSDNTASSITITTGADAKYIVGYVYHAQHDSITADEMLASCQIELGSTATAYEPYNGYQVTVNLGGTYYSGTLDVVTGVFVPDTAEKDLSTLTFRTASQNRWLSNSIISEIKHPSSSELKIKFWSDSYYYTNAVNLYFDQTLIGIAVDNEGNILCRNKDANPPTGYIVYELATPTPIQLSPTMVKALVGENHLSAPLEGQEITESKYKQMFTFDDVIAYIQSLS